MALASHERRLEKLVTTYGGAVDGGGMDKVANAFLPHVELVYAAFDYYSALAGPDIFSLSLNGFLAFVTGVA